MCILTVQKFDQICKSKPQGVQIRCNISRKSILFGQVSDSIIHLFKPTKKKYAFKYLFYSRVNYTSIVLIEFADPKDTKIKGRIVYEPVSKISHFQETKDNFIEDVKFIKFLSVRRSDKSNILSVRPIFYRSSKLYNVK